jgi:hypothetical protein
MRKNSLFMLGFLFSILLFSVVSAETYNSTNNLIFECGDIVEAGNYSLNQSFLGTGSCIKIQSSDVILDGNGFEIRGQGLYGGIEGMLIKDVSNITVKNINVTNFGLAINMNNVSESFFLDNFLSGNAFGSLVAFDSWNNEIVNNQMESNLLEFGVFFNGDSDNNVIRDSIILNNVKDILLKVNSSATLINTTHNTTDVEAGSNLTVKWYLDINATQSDVTIAMDNDTGLAIGRYELVDGNYTIIASKTGYYSANETVEIFGDNANVSFSLTLVPVIQPSSGGGSGGGCSPEKDYDWECSEWSECVDSAQTRTCKETNNCRNDFGRPSTEQSCVVETENKTVVEDLVDPQDVGADGGFFSAITGAVTGGASARNWTIVGIFAIVVIGGLVIVKVKKKGKKKSKK